MSGMDGRRGAAWGACVVPKNTTGTDENDQRGLVGRVRGKTPKGVPAIFALSTIPKRGIKFSGGGANTPPGLGRWRQPPPGIIGITVSHTHTHTLRDMFRKGFIPLLGRVAGSVSERAYQRSEIREAYQPQDRGFGDS